MDNVSCCLKMSSREEWMILEGVDFSLDTPLTLLTSLTSDRVVRKPFILFARIPDFRSREKWDWFDSAQSQQNTLSELGFFSGDAIYFSTIS